MSLPLFPDTPSLPHLQAYIKDLCVARGWDKSPDLDVFLLFVEEVGELAKAIRNRKEIYQEPGKAVNSQELESEFADVFSYLLDLANRFGVDLEAAFRAKEAHNQGRTWE